MYLQSIEVFKAARGLWKSGLAHELDRPQILLNLIKAGKVLFRCRGSWVCLSILESEWTLAHYRLRSGRQNIAAWRSVWCSNWCFHRKQTCFRFSIWSPTLKAPTSRLSSLFNRADDHLLLLVIPVSIIFWTMIVWKRSCITPIWI